MPYAPASILRTIVALAAGLVAIGSRAARAEEWNQWRGPNRNAVSSDAGLPVRWTGEQGVRWKVALPAAGVSSPVIWQDRVFMTAADSRRQDELWMLCLNLADGSERWRLRLWGSAPTLHHGSKSDMATPTPITDGEHVYALFGTGDVFAVDCDGGLAWQRSLASEYGAFENRFGHTSSPALLGDTLFVQCDHYGDSYLLAIDKRTGRNVWKVDRPGVWHSWSSPQFCGTGSQTELVVCAAGRVDAYAPATGERLWTVGGLQRECIPTPVTGHGLIYLVSGPKGLVQAVRPLGRGDVSDTHVSWTSQRGTPFVPSPVLVGEQYFLVDDQGIATCLDALTGELVWQQRLRGEFTASPVAGDGKVYFTNDLGETFVVRAGSDSYEELARNPLGEPVYASAAIAQRGLLLRSPRHLYYIGIANDPPQP